VPTLYQKVKTALEENGPITFGNLARRIQADEDSVRLMLIELKRRGKATCERDRIPKARLWQVPQS